MKRPPRQRNEPLLNAHLVWHVILVSLLILCGVYGIFYYAIERGSSIELARTLAVNTLVMMEVFHMFFIRNIYNVSLTWKVLQATKEVWTTVIIIIVAQFAITYLPPIQKLFMTQSVGLTDNILTVGIGAALFIIIEAEKQIRLSFKQIKES